jgi:hypothetical protein
MKGDSRVSNLRAIPLGPEPEENPHGQGAQFNGRRFYPQVRNLRVPEAQLCETRKELGGLLANRQDTNHNNAAIAIDQLLKRIIQARQGELVRGFLSVKHTAEAGEAIQGVCLQHPEDSVPGLMACDLAGEVTTDMVASDPLYREAYRTGALEIAQKGKY